MKGFLTLSLMLAALLAAAEPRVHIVPGGGGGAGGGGGGGSGGGSSSGGSGSGGIIRGEGGGADSAPPGGAFGDSTVSPTAGAPRTRVVPGTPPGGRASQAYYYPSPYYWGGYGWTDPYGYGRIWWNDNWWWHDPHYHRWHYWHDNTWIIVPQGQATPPQTESAPQAPTAGGTFRSPDGSRMVQIAGPSSDAFLYDVEGSTAGGKYMTRMAAGVEGARFSGGKKGSPLRIMLELRGGQFEIFDRNGKKVE